MSINLENQSGILQEKIMNGDNSFMEKMSERVAYERTGMQLYEALLNKYDGNPEQDLYPNVEIIERFLHEKKSHFHTACSVMEEIGGDCSRVTSSSELAQVTSSGWFQAISNPKTNFKQALEILLQAELIDNAYWEVLIELAEDVGLSKFAVEFQKCLNEEAMHLSTIKDWVRQLNLNGKVERPLSQ